MRLRRLDLIRYGKFTDRAIDFGPKPQSGPDLHIVFGMNEAGKSTALSGYLDLLFGIEERSRYNFLHEYGAMRIGGVLELGGAEQIFTRTKQRANSLLNAAAQPVSLATHTRPCSRWTTRRWRQVENQSWNRAATWASFCSRPVPASGTLAIH
jgi:hypothetical protein